MDQPLVSIITPTIPSRREALLSRCVPSVHKQTYPNIEHIVVSDGPGLDGYPWAFRHVDLGRNWCQLTGGNSIGSIPRLVGTYLAKGEYIGYLDDDDEFLPQHVEKLVALIQRTGVDFVHSQFLMHWSDGRPNTVFGCDGVVHCAIGTPMVLHKAECLLVSNWQLGGDAEDFQLFSAWDKAGLKHAYLPEITIHVHKKLGPRD